MARVLSNYAKDKFVAPEMSTFTAASIRDMSAVSGEQDHWVLNFVLNTMLRVSVEGSIRPTLFNFLRRTEAAFREYTLARIRTLAYLANPDAVSDYLAAIAHWEVFLSQAYQAYCLFTMGQPTLFKRGDGSVFQRLNLLYNRAKHVESAIASHQLPEDGTIAVWLKNDGLHSIDGSLTFDEIAEILEDLSRYADAVQDPLTMREKLTVLAEEEDEGGKSGS
jgi:hypothetical protein